MIIILLYIVGIVVKDAITFENIILPNCTIMSWESVSLSLTNDTIKDYLIIFSQVTKHKEPGDIVLYTNQNISTISIYVFNDISKIIPNYKGEYPYYDWKFSSGDYFRIESKDPKYKLNSSYYFLISLTNLVFEDSITIFNELDIKTLKPNYPITIRHLYSKRQLMFNYKNTEHKEMIVFAFTIDDPILYVVYNGILSISNSKGKVIHQWDLVTKRQFIYCHNVTSYPDEDDTYVIIVYIFNMEGTKVVRFNMEIEVDTMVGVPNYLEHNSCMELSLIPNMNYYFYIDVREYDVYEENLVEIWINEKSLKSEISSNLIVNNGFSEKEERDIRYDIPSTKVFDDYIKVRGKKEMKYKLIPFIKENSYQKFFIVAIKLNITSPRSIHKFYISISPRVKHFHLTYSIFNSSNIFEIETLPISNHISSFLKITYDQNLLSKYQSLSFYVTHPKISLIMLGPMLLPSKTPNTISRWSKYQIIDISHSVPNNTIMFAFLGSVNMTSVQVGLIQNALIYFMNTSHKLNEPFNFELTNCKNTLYYIESFDDNNKSKVSLLYDILYGKHSMIYYNKIESPLIISSDNEGSDISSKRYFIFESENYNVLKINCISPLNIRITFINNGVETNKENIINNGDSIFFQLDSTLHYDFVFNTSEVGLFYKVNIHSYSDTILDIVTQDDNYTLDKETKEINLIYQNMFTSKLPMLGIDAKEMGDVFIRIKMASNELMNTVIEGNNEIQYENNKINHRLRNDIIYDYLEITMYSKRKVDNILMKYSFDKYDHVQMNGVLPQNKYSFHKESVLHFSNPYNKYNLHLGENESFYYSMQILNQNESDYNVYVNINYYKTKAHDTSIGGNIIKYGTKYRMENAKEYMNSFVFYFSKCKDTKNYSFQFILTYGNDEVIEIKDNTTLDNFYIFDNVYNGSLFEIRNKENLTDSNESLYVNYFYTNKEYLNKYNLKQKYNINSTYNKGRMYLKWNPLFNNSHNVVYKIYFLPLISNISINDITYLSQINHSFIVHNFTRGYFDIEPLNYKINIIAKCKDNLFPFEIIYNGIDVIIPYKGHAVFTTGVIVFIVICVVVVLYIVKRRGKKYKKKSKRKKEKVNQQLIEKAQEQEEGIFKSFDEEDEESVSNVSCSDNSLSFSQENDL